jgi:three-Cys-motif partner protein
VAVPKDTIWAIEPHTSAKHQILRKYLDAWLPILGTYNKRIVYIDGFSGPGQYTGREPGSPIIALEAARTHEAKLPSELVFLFIEERQDRVDHLNGEIAKLGIPSHFKVHVEQGTFAEKLTETLNALDAEGGKIAPTFALIDPFGFAGIPYELIKRLLGKNKCEVLITFMVDSINRWLTHPDDSIRAHIIDTFGTEEALKIAFGGGDRAEGLKNLYHSQLNKVAKFVRYFEMRDRDGRLVYYLFFASNNALGHLKMKEAMWKVDPMGDFRFSDSTDPTQTLLFDSPSTAPLAVDLVAKLKGAGQIPVQKVELYTNDCTAYLRKHMGEVLKQLESEGKLKVAEMKTDGKKRHGKTFPNEVQVTFL